MTADILDNYGRWNSHLLDWLCYCHGRWNSHIGWNCFKADVNAFVADVIPLGHYFSLSSMLLMRTSSHIKKPCQLDWQKLVFHEKICSVSEKIEFLIENQTE